MSSRQSESPEVCWRHTQYVNVFGFLVCFFSLCLFLFVFGLHYSEVLPEAEDTTQIRLFAFESVLGGEELDNSTCMKQ